MGLDAVVYRNRKHISLGFDEAFAKTDEVTGELYFDDLKLERKYHNQREATACRLGNIAAITALDHEITQLIGHGSLISRKILFSGTHAGDAIPLKDLPVMSAELAAIRQTGLSSPLLLEFVSSMEQLVKAANEEQNPIVFS